MFSLSQKRGTKPENAVGKGKEINKTARGQETLITWKPQRPKRRTWKNRDSIFAMTLQDQEPYRVEIELNGVKTCMGIDSRAAAIIIS